MNPTPPQIKEQIQAILDGCEGVTPGPWGCEYDRFADAWYVTPKADAPPEFGSWAPFAVFGLNDETDERNARHLQRLVPDTVKTICTLALRGLEATANEPGEAVTEVPEIKFAIADYLELRDEAHGFVSTDEERSASAIELHDAIQRIHAKITHPAPQDGVPAPVVSDEMVERAGKAMAREIRNQDPDWTEDYDEGEYLIVSPSGDYFAIDVATRAALTAALEGQP